MKRILVTGAGGSASHNFIDSLRISGEEFYIVGVDTKPYHLEMAEVDKRYIVPLARDPDYIPTLNRIIDNERVGFVHPQPDIEVEAISKNRDKLLAKVFLPEHDVIETFADKMKCNEILREKGVNVPEAYPVSSEVDLEEALVKLLRRHEKVWLRAIHGAGSRASLPVRNLYHARAWIDYWREMKGVGYGDFMVGEFLPGKEFAFQSIWRDGQLVTSQARERIEYIFGHLTPSGQTSSPSVAKTVHRADVNEVATRAVKAIAPGATGVFCVDMKENARGEVCLTEVNAGRFFTTSNFFAHAGCNMPYYLVRMAYGEDLPELPKYNPLPPDLYWVRMIDMGYRLVKGEEWTSVKI